MKNIALIGITMNAVGPMENCLKKFPQIHARHYMDSSLSEKIAEKGIDDECMGRMLSMISSACTDGAQGIILTCTVFSKYVKLFQALFSCPIIGADVAMMEQAGSIPGKKALLCTFASTKEPSTKLLERCCEEHGVEPDIDTYLLEDAYIAVSAGDRERHDELIRNKVLELGNTYDQIILAQMSMADAAPDTDGMRAIVFTSPKAACETILVRAK